MADIDQTAIAIGRLYQQAQSCGSASKMLYIGDAAKQLMQKKESIGHGQWQSWIETNRSVLGFGKRGARALIKGAQWMAANWQLANTYEEIVTNPNATAADLQHAHEIKVLWSYQFQPTRRGTLSHRHDEWYTPPETIERARTALGGIDLDPASCAVAQETVRASRYFDKEQNGLTKPWDGNVWLNPPFSPKLVRQFILKLLAEWNSGRIAAAIALTHNNTDAMWFHDMISAAAAVCFTYGRISFSEHGAERVSPIQGQAFFYFGRDCERFIREFSRIGCIARPEPNNPWSRRRVRDEEQTAQPN